MLGLLVQRTWPTPGAKRATPEAPQLPAHEQWFGVYQQEQKIGYSHERWSVEAGGTAFTEESLLRLTIAGSSQTVRMHLQAHANADMSLHDVDFELSSGAGDLRASAVVSGAVLHLTLHTGGDTSEQDLPLTEPVYMPATFRASLTSGHLRPGETLEALVFDPTTLKNDRIRLTVDALEPVPGAAPGVRGWHVHEEYRAIKTQVWVDENGTALREEGPMGLVLLRQTQEQAVNQGWSGDAALDLVARVAVPVAHPIADARNRTALRVRLTGIAMETIPTDEEQRRDGAIIRIQRAPIGTLRSYRLPYTELDHADELRPTAFLQSDHPRVQAVVREALGGEQDALAAAQRLNDWVYTHLRKVPTVSIPNALQVLDMGAGDCNEHAVLLAALSRAAGLPARVVAGAVYLDGAFYYHAWCEVWLGRWASIDPAFDQFPADATHIKFVVGGPEEHIAMVDIIGRLGIDVLDDESAAAR